MSLFTFKKSLIIGILIALLCLFDKFYLPKLYIFSPKKLQELSIQAIKKFPDDTEALLNHLAESIKKEYGNSVLPLNHNKWFFNNAGNAMGSMILLHASISEYLIFFGTSIGTEGHSGVHLSDDYFTILVGEQRSSFPGQFKPTIYKPGMQNHLPRGKRVQYSIPGECWALELAQGLLMNFDLTLNVVGWIPSMLPFGLIETFFSTLDFNNLWLTLRYTSEAMFKSFINGKF
ncbi:hypothetical protein PORY_000311 [Pneumocystis oryctolagi]|uniref:Uncharacterized protein n=1 Tax=Pneumocystis oryctolagi TaxID=42067 RepID=A0ACB7CGS8_9ASCO|nr:hypothetical protein PORY_000311 [Pneumocystis oryctolagi]